MLSFRRSSIASALRRTLLPAALLCLIFAAPALFAQTDNATLSGAVLDPTGARIPDAVIVLKSTSSRDTRNGMSNSDGVYNFSALPPATYTLTVTRTGFTTAREVGITLHPADTRSLNITLKVGETTTEVVVNADDAAPSNGERTSLISGERHPEPVGREGRDISELVKTQAGFAIVPPVGITNGTYDPGRVTVGGGLSNFVANGAPATGINVTANGADITDPTSGNSTTQNINQEMVQEVQIETSAFGADTAKGPIVLNAVTKSGSTTYHGAVYGYVRSHVLDTQNWFSKNQGLPDSPDRSFYPGANIGGPVKLPFKNFNNSKRLTFFLGAEDYVQRNV